MQEQYDFFMIGQKHANDTLSEIKRLAQEYEKQYGKEAREEFENGIASEISQYFNTLAAPNDNINEEMGGSIKYGVRNARNNSYFGRKGISSQYIYTPTGPIYNDPDKSSRKK